MTTPEDRDQRAKAEGYLTVVWRKLGKVLGPFLAKRLRQDYLSGVTDVYTLLKQMKNNWFDQLEDLGQMTKNRVHLLAAFRSGLWAHQGIYTLEEIDDALRNIVFVLDVIEGGSKANTVRQNWEEVRGMFSGPSTAEVVPSLADKQFLFAANYKEVRRASSSEQTSQPADFLAPGVTQLRFFTDMSSVALQAMAHHQQGNDLLLLGQYDIAVSEYDIAIRIMSTSAESYYMRGIAKAYRNDDQGMAEDADRAMRHNASFDSNILRSAEYLRTGYEALGAGNIEQAREHYDALIRENPDFALAYNHRGIAYGRQDRLDEAISEFRKAININPHCAAAYFNLGRHYFRAKRYDLAIDSLAKAGELDSDNASIWYEQGRAYGEIWDYAQAVSSFSRAVDIDRGHERAQSSLQEARRDLGNHYQSLQEFANAISVYRQVLETDPYDSSTRTNLGQIHMDQGDYAEAMSCFKQVTLLEPDNAVGWAHLGAVCINMGDYSQAAASFLRVVELMPDDYTGLGNLGATYVHMGEYDRAITYLKRAEEMIGGVDRTDEVSLPTHLNTIYLHLGNAYGFSGQHYEAIDFYQRAIEMDEANAGLFGTISLDTVRTSIGALAWHNMSISYGDIGDCDNAIACLSRAIETGLDGADIWLHLAILQFHAGDHEQALHSCQRVMEKTNDGDLLRQVQSLTDLVQNPVSQYDREIEQRPDDPGAWHLRGLYFYDQGEFESAVRDLTQAILLRADGPGVWFDRGLAYSRQENGDQALSDYTKAICIDPSCSDAYYQRALIRRRMGEYGRALEDLSSAIELTNHAAAYQHRGIIRQRLGDYEQAEVDLAQARALGYMP